MCEVLSGAHDLATFSSGEASLDDWLRKSARNSDGRNVTKTYVWHAGDDVVVAYYSLMPFLIEASDMSKRQTKGLPDRIPCYLVARLALDESLQGDGRRLGSQLLLSALLRAASAADDASGRYIVVDALNERACSFYLHHGLEPLERRKSPLIIRVKDIAQYLGQ